MTWILFYALLTSAGTTAVNTQEFNDENACRGAVEALEANWKAAPAFCVPKGTEADEVQTPTPSKAASGGSTAKAPTARK